MQELTLRAILNFILILACSSHIEGFVNLMSEAQDTHVIRETSNADTSDEGQTSMDNFTKIFSDSPAAKFLIEILATKPAKHDNASIALFQEGKIFKTEEDAPPIQSNLRKFSDNESFQDEQAELKHKEILPLQLRSIDMPQTFRNIAKISGMGIGYSSNKVAAEENVKSTSKSRAHSLRRTPLTYATMKKAELIPAKNVSNNHKELQVLEQFSNRSEIDGEATARHPSKLVPAKDSSRVKESQLTSLAKKLTLLEAQMYPKDHSVSFGLPPSNSNPDATPEGMSLLTTSAEPVVVSNAKMWGDKGDRALSPGIFFGVEDVPSVAVTPNPQITTTDPAKGQASHPAEDPLDRLSTASPLAGRPLLVAYSTLMMALASVLYVYAAIFATQEDISKYAAPLSFAYGISVAFMALLNGIIPDWASIALSWTILAVLCGLVYYPTGKDQLSTDIVVYGCLLLSSLAYALISGIPSSYLSPEFCGPAGLIYTSMSRDGSYLLLRLYYALLVAALTVLIFFCLPKSTRNLVSDSQDLESGKLTKKVIFGFIFAWPPAGLISQLLLFFGIGEFNPLEPLSFFYIPSQLQLNSWEAYFAILTWATLIFCFVLAQQQLHDEVRLSSNLIAQNVKEQWKKLGASEE